MQLTCDSGLRATSKEETEQVLSFEELAGSHGGLGGPQERPFLAAPPDWPRLETSPVGAPSIHRQLHAWIAALSGPVDAGHPAAP